MDDRRLLRAYGAAFFAQVCYQTPVQLLSPVAARRHYPPLRRMQRLYHPDDCEEFRTVPVLRPAELFQRAYIGVSFHSCTSIAFRPPSASATFRRMMIRRLRCDSRLICKDLSLFSACLNWRYDLKSTRYFNFGWRRFFALLCAIFTPV